MAYDSDDSKKPAIGFTLKGIPAIILILLLAGGYVGYRLYLQEDLEGNPQLRSQIETQLRVELSGGMSRDLDAVETALQKGDKDQAEAFAERAMQRKATIDELAMRQTNDGIIVKADYTLTGPDGDVEKTGYYLFTHGAVGGWSYQRESSELSWNLAIF